MRVHDCNWQMLEAYLAHDDRIVLPIGSTEQHGYLSVGTDAILAERVAVEAAEPLGVPVLPALREGARRRCVGGDLPVAPRGGRYQAKSHKAPQPPADPPTSPSRRAAPPDRRRELWRLLRAARRGGPRAVAYRRRGGARPHR